jgi:hypothetical protein
MGKVWLTRIKSLIIAGVFLTINNILWLIYVIFTAIGDDDIPETSKKIIDVWNLIIGLPTSLFWKNYPNALASQDWEQGATLMCFGINILTQACLIVFGIEFLGKTAKKLKSS